MPQTTILSDAQLRQLYFGIAKHYKECSERQPAMTIGAIYDELYNGVYYSVNSNATSLSQLDPAEKLKAFKVLNTFFYASPHFRAALPQQQANFFRYGAPPAVIIHHYHGPRYCGNNDLLFTWLLLSSFNRPYYPYYGGQHHHNTHTHPNKKKDGTAQIVALLILVALSAAAAALTFVALYYLLSECVNTSERFMYSEGWLQATLPCLGMAAGATAVALLSTLFVMAPLASLAMAAGLANPIGIAIVGVVCLTIMGATAGCFITDQIQKYAIKKANSDALDPADPNRFTLTTEEAQVLINNGIDPIKVKCAIVALRAQIGDKPVPSLLTRSCCSAKGSEIQDCLNKVRQLRRGELAEVDVGSMHFDCKEDRVAYQPQPPAYPIYLSAPMQTGYAEGLYPNALHHGQVPQQPYPFGAPVANYQRQPSAPPYDYSATVTAPMV